MVVRKRGRPSGKTYEVILKVSITKRLDEELRKRAAEEDITPSELCRRYLKDSLRS